MGESDDNDAIAFDDGYTDEERPFVYNAFAKTMMSYRWDIVKSVYKEMGIKAVLKTFEDIGHSTDLALNMEITNFFNNYK